MKVYEHLHSFAVNELKSRGYRWTVQGDFWALQGFKNRKLLDWRLWESVENLDVQRFYARELLKHARGRRWRDTREALKEIIRLFDESIGLLDPKHWRGVNKHFKTIEPTEENVSKVLQNLIQIRRLIYTNRLALGEIEKSNQECWIALTFMLYIDVLDSIHGCKKWLESVGGVKSEENGLPVSNP